MSNIDTSSWKEFKLYELFSAESGDFDIKKEHINGLGVEVVTAGETENGILGKSDITAKIFDGNTITIDMFGKCTYRPDCYKMVTHARVFSLKCLFADFDEKSGLYMTTMLQKLVNGFSYSNMCSWNKIKDLSIKLPVKESEEIDWEYMQERITELEQERITELEQERITELEQYLIATGLNDYELTDEDKTILATKLTAGGALQNSMSGNGCLKEARMFRVGDLFEKINPRFYGKPNTYIGRKSCTTTEPDATHTVPLTCAKYDNNGIMYYGEPNLFESVANCLVMIRDGAVSTGLVFAHEDPVGVLSHSYLMKCKVDVSFRSLLYISSVMTKTLYPRYNRSDPSYWDGKVENDKILLPVTCDGTPDWTYMEKYIRAIEKVVIKGVVDYKDSIIAKTKEIVA